MNDPQANTPLDSKTRRKLEDQRRRAFRRAIEERSESRRLAAEYSLDALLRASLEKLSNEEVRVRVIHAGVGAINASRDIDRDTPPSIAAEEPADEPAPTCATEEPVYTTAFRVTGTLAKLKALKQYMMDNGLVAEKMEA